MRKETTTKKRTTSTRKKAAKAASPTYLGLVEEVRTRQLNEGNFDCFGRAAAGYCDQGNCYYRAECLDISSKLDN